MKTFCICGHPFAHHAHSRAPDPAFCIEPHCTCAGYKALVAVMPDRDAGLSHDEAAQKITVVDDLDRVREGLVDARDDQRAIAERGLAFVAMLLRKNADYGGSVWKRPILKPSLAPGDAILVRMSDKIERLAHMAGHEAEVADESYEDTMSDLAAYAILFLGRPRS